MFIKRALHVKATRRAPTEAPENGVSWRNCNAENLRCAVLLLLLQQQLGKLDSVAFVQREIRKTGNFCTKGTQNSYYFSSLLLLLLLSFCCTFPCWHSFVVVTGPGYKSLCRTPPLSLLLLLCFKEGPPAGVQNEKYGEVKRGVLDGGITSPFLACSHAQTKTGTHTVTPTHLICSWQKF